MSSTFGSTSAIETLENNKVKITLNITPEFLEEGMKQAYTENKNKINLPGFRKGKVPRKIIEMQYGKSFFYEDAINNVLPVAYEEAVDTHNIDVVSRPEIDVTEIDSEKGAVVTCEVQLKPEASVAGYKGLEYERVDCTVSEDEVNAEIEKDREKNARFVPVTDRETINGDITVIDFEGFVDGVAFDGGKGLDFELTLGSGQFIPGFEEQLIGKNAGDDVKVYVNFPEDYHAEELKGKPAVFEVKIKSFRAKEVPDLDDDFAQDISEFDTLEEYKKSIRDRLEHEKTHQAEHDKEEKIIDALNEKTTVEIPESMVETEVDQMVSSFARRMTSQGMSFDMFLQYTGMNMEMLRNSYKKSAERSVKARLALEAVAKAENFEVTDEETFEDITRVASENNVDPETLKSHMSKSEYKGLQIDLKVQKALKLITDNAVEVEPRPKEDESKTE